MQKIRKMIKKIKGEYNRVSYFFDEAGKSLMELGKEIYEKKSSPQSLQLFSEKLFELEKLVAKNKFLEDYEPIIIYEIGFRTEKLYHLTTRITFLLDSKDFQGAKLYFRILLSEFEQFRSLVLG